MGRAFGKEQPSLLSRNLRFVTELEGWWRPAPTLRARGGEMTAEWCPLGWQEGVFHGETAMEVEGWAEQGDFRPAEVTEIHGGTAIFVVGAR